jgi:phage-related protein
MEVIYAGDWIQEFIKNQDSVTWARVAKIVSRLQTYGHDIGLPFSRSLGDGLFELRTVGKKQVRLIYIFNQDRVCILHAFLKKTGRIPKREIEYAKAVRRNLFA